MLSCSIVTDTTSLDAMNVTNMYVFSIFVIFVHSFFILSCLLKAASLHHTEALANRLTHSLLRLTCSDGRSDIHNERSCADDHSESIVHP